MLTNLPSLDEIKNAVFSMCDSSAPGPDGFGGCFFQHFYETVGPDVYSSVIQFFSQSWMLPNLNSNIVVLIPKFTRADRISDFRPIA